MRDWVKRQWAGASKDTKYGVVYLTTATIGLLVMSLFSVLALSCAREIGKVPGVREFATDPIGETTRNARQTLSDLERRTRPY